jgi:HAE1 family hydrophobic/amphiphilic exporter-1
MLAITMATLTTIIVFLPVSLVEGQAQFFLLRLSIPISVALAASLAVAGIFVPLSVYLTLPNGEPAARSRRQRTYAAFNRLLERAYEATLGRLNHAYTAMLEVALRRRLDVVLIMAAVFALTIGVAFKEVTFVEVQEEERSGFEIDVRMPQGSTLEETEQFFLDCEKVIEGMQEELGLAGWFLFHFTTGGELQGWFDNPRSADVSPREATERVLERLPKRPGVKLYTSDQSQLEEEKGEEVFVVSLYGEDAEALEETAERLEGVFGRVDGVLAIKAAGDPSPNELALVVDRQQAQQQEINPQVIAGVVGYALRGQALKRYRTGGKDIPVRVRFDEADRETLAQLKGFYVPAGEQGFVPLSSVTDVQFLPAPTRILRRNKRTTRTITLELEAGREEETRQRLRAVQRQINLPEGIRFGVPSQRNQEQEDLAALKFAMSVSVVFIYLLMGFLFESFILPLSIICTIPLAAIGVGWSHYVAGLDLDFLGGVGMVLLIGVVVNNGIVLIDYVNRLRAAGMERQAALLRAAERRFRPIMMTALTTICGMVPVTLSGATSIGLSYTSFGLALIGGLTTATLLTLLVVPVFYTLFDDARTVVARSARWAVGGAPQASAE